MFGIDDGTPLPQAYLTDHQAWDRYIGGLWHGLLRHAGFQAEDSVIEIAPGGSTKIGSALALAGYRGHLYIVDAAASVIEALKPKYAALLPDATLHWICAPFAESIDALPQECGFLLASHMIDDMILSKAAQGSDVFSWAAAYTHRPTEALARAWTAVSGDAARLAKVKNDVAEEVIGAVERLSPRHILFNQYPSSTLYENGLSSLNDHAFDVFAALKNRYRGDAMPDKDMQALFDSERNFGNAHIGRHILNAEYWMLCKRVKN